MADILLRLGVLLLVSGLLWLLVWMGRRFVERKRQQVLATTPTVSSITSDSNASTAAVRILAFSSADCRQCHTLQAPALQRVLAVHGDNILVVDVDATSSPELVQNYHVLTVPTTVVLTSTGRAHAVNYGFANAQRLLQQVDEVLAQTQEPSLT